MASQIYHCAQLTHGFYKVTIPSGVSPTPTVAGKTAIGTSVNSRYGIWVFGPTKQEIWVSGAGHATASLSSSLWRSQNGGVAWTNEYSRLSGSPSNQNDVGVLMGIGATPAGNLWAAGSAAFVGNRGWRSPSPMDSNPFTDEIIPTPPWGINQMYAVENPTRLWSTEGSAISIAVIRYWNGSSWTVASKTGIVHRAPATQISLAGGVWVDAANNRVYIMARDNNSPAHYYVFRKAADAPADPWVEDNYFGAIATTGWSARGFGSNYSRQLNGCQKTGAVYMLYSGLTNQSSLQRRDPGTGVWTLVKVGTTGGQNDLWVVDDDHLLAYPICKNETGYYTIGVDIPALPGGEQPMAVWGDTEYPDTDAPYLLNLSPYSGEVGVDPFGNIVLEIHDDGDGVNDATVTIIVNGTAAWTADAEANPSVYAVGKTVLGTGLRYTINPVGMLPPGTTTVEVYAEDNAS